MAARTKPAGARRPAKKAPRLRRAAKPAKRTRSTAKWTATPQRRLRPYVPTACPICGSRDLDVQKADRPLKLAGKVAASTVVPFLVLEFRDRATCRSCGWRSEANH